MQFVIAYVDHNYWQKCTENGKRVNLLAQVVQAYKTVFVVKC
jgi:hypothetical protein